MNTEALRTSIPRIPSALGEKLKSSISALREKNDFLKESEIAAQLRSLVANTSRNSNGLRPGPFFRFVRAFRNQHGLRAYEILRKAAVLLSMDASHPIIFSNEYPAVTTTLFLSNFERILEMCELPAGWSEHADDVFWKDLAIARLTCFPSRGRIFEMSSGISRKLILSAQWSQSYTFTKMLYHLGGSRHYFQGHVHTPLVHDFTPQGWTLGYLQVAEMLDRYPHIKGVFGATWYYDPAIAEISPKIAYMRNTQIENGAYSFYCKKDLSGSALVRSKTRNDLFERGIYVPKVYMLVWGRDDLLRWASKEACDTPPNKTGH